MMPKGVEHTFGEKLRAAAKSVIVSLMPKGVEHLVLPFSPTIALERQ